MVTAPTKIVIVVNELWFFLSHRLPIALAAQEAGYEVHIASRHGTDKEVERITQQGLAFHAVGFERSSLNFRQELQALQQLIRLYRELQPDLVHHVTIKPVLYGTLAARWVGNVQILNAISGLGYLFIAQGWKSLIRKRVLLWGYRFLLNSKKVWILFQNPDDQALFVANRVVYPGHVRMIKGSGVDLQKFEWSQIPSGPPIVLLVARMLWDKGVGELVQAASILQKTGVNARFLLAGGVDLGNPESISVEQLEQWNQDGVVEWLGERSDIAQLLESSHIVVLPSYREGLPKSLIEAAAVGRPIVTTDVPGCREVVQDRVNGRLVPARDEDKLADAIQELLQDPERLGVMGRKGREMAEQKFSLQHVVEQTLKLYSAINKSGSDCN